MNRIHNALQEIDIVGKLADLKDQHYANTLLLSAIVELLVENNILTTDQLNDKIKDLDRLAMPGNPIRVHATKREADHPSP